MRYAWWNKIQMAPERCLEESGGCNLIMAFILLGVIMIDILLGWHDNLFLATNEDDQIVILVYVFGAVGYFIAMGFIDCYLGDYFEKPIGFLFDVKLNVFYVKTCHFLLVLLYSIRWLMMYADDWNPAIYYSPMYFKYSLFCISGYLFLHLAQTGISVFSLYKARNSSKIDFYGA